MLRPLSQAASISTSTGKHESAASETAAACINDAEAVASKLAEPLATLMCAPVNSAEDSPAMDACRWALLQGLVPGDRIGHSGNASSSAMSPLPLPLPGLPTSVGAALSAAGRLAVLVKVAEAWAKSSSLSSAPSLQVSPARAIELASLIAAAAELVPDSCGKPGAGGHNALWAKAGATTGALWALACRSYPVNGVPQGGAKNQVSVGPSLEALLLALADPHPRAHALAHSGALAWLHHLPSVGGSFASPQQQYMSQQQHLQHQQVQRPAGISARAAAVRFLARAACSPRCEPELARRLCHLLASALDCSKTNEPKQKNPGDLMESDSSTFEKPLLGAQEVAVLVENLPSTQALRFELLSTPPPSSDGLPVSALRLLILVLARQPALSDYSNLNGSSVGWRVGCGLDSEALVATTHRCHEYSILCHELLQANERSMNSGGRSMNLGAILDLALAVLAPSSAAPLPAATHPSAVARGGLPRPMRAWCAPRLESSLASLAAKHALAGVARTAEVAASTCAAAAAAEEGAGHGSQGRSKATPAAAVGACYELAAALARLRCAALARLPGLDSLTLVAALRNALTRLDRGRARCGGLNPLKSQKIFQQPHRFQQQQQPMPGNAAATSVASVLVEACLCLASLAHATPAPASDELMHRSACGPPPPTLAKEASELARLLASVCPPPAQPRPPPAHPHGGSGYSIGYDSSTSGSAVHWTGALRLALVALASSNRPDTSLVGDAFAPLVGGWPSPPPPPRSGTADSHILHNEWWTSILCGPSVNDSATSDALDVSSVEALRQHAQKRRRDVASHARAVESSRKPRTATWAPPGSSSTPWGAAPAPRGGAFEIGLAAGQGVPSLSLNGRTLKVTFEYDLGEQTSVQPFPDGAYSVALQGMRADGNGGASARLLLS